MRFGVQVSIAGGVHKGLLRAVQLGCDCVQMFLMIPRGWKASALPDEEIERFHKIRNSEAKKIRPIAVQMFGFYWKTQPAREWNSVHNSLKYQNFTP